MTTLCTLTSQQYKAALNCISKDKARLQITGILLSGKDKTIVSTNGHVLYWTNVDIESNEDIIFTPCKMPGGTASVQIDQHDKGLTLTFINKNNLPVAKVFADILDWTYPDYKAIINSKTDEKAYTKFSFDTVYLALLKVVFGNTPVSFELLDNMRPAVVRSTHDSEGALIIMPCRL